MSLFEVTLSDGSTRIMQAHSKKLLAQALQGVTLSSVMKRPTCRACYRVVATVQHCLCAACYAQAATSYQQACPDLPLEGQELECLICSFFVGG